MPENEIELTGQIGTPAWSPFQGKAGLRLRRTWGERVVEYRHDVVDASGYTIEQIETSCDNSEPLADVLAAGAERVVRVSDREYRTAIARLAAAAFKDEAKIDEVAFLTSVVVQMEPAHLRVLRSMDPRREVDGHLPDLGDLSRPMITAIKDQLVGFGFVEDVSMNDQMFGRVDTSLSSLDGIQRQPQRPTTYERRWQVTTWGFYALDLCDDHLQR